MVSRVCRWFKYPIKSFRLTVLPPSILVHSEWPTLGLMICQVHSTRSDLSLVRFLFANLYLSSSFLPLPKYCCRQSSHSQNAAVMLTMRIRDWIRWKARCGPFHCEKFSWARSCYCLSIDCDKDLLCSAHLFIYHSDSSKLNSSHSGWRNIFFLLLNWMWFCEIAL